MQPRGGARIFSICTVTLSNIQDGEIWGPNPHPDVCGLVINNESKHNVWLKTDSIATQKICNIYTYR